MKPGKKARLETRITRLNVALNDLIDELRDQKCPLDAPIAILAKKVCVIVCLMKKWFEDSIALIDEANKPFSLVSDSEENQQ